MPFLILFDIHCHHNEVLSMAALEFLNPDITDFGYWENMVGPTFHDHIEECNKSSSSGTPSGCRNHTPHLKKFKRVILPRLKREQRLHNISCLVLRFHLHIIELLVWDNWFWFERPSCSTLISWYRGTTSCGSPSDHHWKEQWGPWTKNLILNSPVRRFLGRIVFWKMTRNARLIFSPIFCNHEQPKLPASLSFWSFCLSFGEFCLSFRNFTLVIKHIVSQHLFDIAKYITIAKCL